MALIWWLSSDVDSGENSSRFVGWLVSVLAPWMTPGQTHLLHGLVRKLSHVVEYGILAALWFRALHRGQRLAPAPSVLAALLGTVAWAVIDEIHQAFVPTRSGTVVDVLLDTMGAALTLALLRSRAATRPPLRVARTVSPSD
jgi:VanZ family protein